MILCFFQKFESEKNLNDHLDLTHCHVDSFIDCGEFLKTEIEVEETLDDNDPRNLQIKTEIINSIKSDVIIKKEDKGEEIKENLTTDHQSDIDEHGFKYEPTKDKITLANYRKFFKGKS